MFEENWPALEVFLACQTQWNYAGMGSATGINYQSMESVMRMMQTDDVPATFKKVRLIESGALKQLSKISAQ